MLVISYKKDYSTSCRGCVMDRYSSDFKIYHFITEDEAIEHCASLDAQTRFDQDSGEDAWEHYFVPDGFEKQMQVQQCYDPDLDGLWTSQNEAENFFKPEQQNRITARAAVIYEELVANHRAFQARKQKQEQEEQLRREIAKAKVLLAKHQQEIGLL